MSASRVLTQIVKLIKEGRVPEKVAADILQASRVEFVVNGIVGYFENGMLKVGESCVSLDPLSISQVRMPIEWNALIERQHLKKAADQKKAEEATALKANEQAQAERAVTNAKGRVVGISVATDFGIEGRAGPK